MSETVGGLIDKLMTVDLKMYYNQDLIYEIRRMTFEEYKTKYFSDEEGAEKLWTFLKKACDLNIQRNQLIDEIDTRVVELVKAAVEGRGLDEFIQRKHKSY
ncbi:hypothetical protein M0R72_01695 [Candidatus Pacearchaeota archaeon]|jgi:hypothetical protein|nr:hypothetical protein [Candidatus Pacearchaeota archaeon]